ncbi:MAG: D-glycerate dehydrogenase [Bacteroidetes bacterium]|nr:D-glycerate dehydrogenase [Bacteroidota bacterium]MBS1974946.1 D-glycerate dehydrogenase [Bacteroidota bacterium]
MKVFITRQIPQKGLDLLRSAGISFTEWAERRELEQNELINICKNYDALISVGQNKINKRFLQECRHLKAIAQMAVGFDNINVAEATMLKIPIGNTPGVLSKATADIAFLLMLAVSRKAFYMHKKIINGEWGFYEPTADLGMEMEEKTLGIFGLGKIGFEMAKRCAGAFNMKIIYHNRKMNDEAEKKLNAKRVSLDELLAQSDVLSVHTALTEETRGFFDYGRFAGMKHSAIFINTARGAIHNEPDLIRALNEKLIWGAGLDVTHPEPMHADNPLLQMPNVAVLPHIGTTTEETRDAMSKLAAENIIAASKNEQLPHIVNPEVYAS